MNDFFYIFEPSDENLIVLEIQIFWFQNKVICS